MTPGRAPVDVTGVTLRPLDRPAPAETSASRSPADTPTMGAGAASERPGDAADEELAPGTVFTRYVIVTRLGAGGMGVVYRAHDAQLDRDVALKVMRVSEGGSDGRARMLREAQAVAKIRHPNVVTVYDADVVLGRVFIAMELIDGVTLKAYFRGKPRRWREVVEIMLGAGEGLAAAHAAGLVHRDFKPDNVLVESGQRVRVLDFGLARPAYDVDGPTLKAEALANPSRTGSQASVLRTLTQTGTVVGTPAYMAPEQHLGRGVDARSDQFSFCVTLYECLFRARPFAGDTQSELTLNVVEGKLQWPAERGDAPPELIALLQRGLATEPGQRFPAMEELLAELRAIVRRHEPRDRRGVLAVLLALAVGGGVAGLALGVGGGEGPAAVAEPDRKDMPEQPGAKGQVETPPAAAPDPPVASKPPQVVIDAPKGVEPEALAAVIRPLLPQGTAAEAVPEGVALVGPKAAAWRDAVNMLALELGRRPARPGAPVYAQVPTPAGTVAIHALTAAELKARAPAMERQEGVHAVATSEALQVALVLATPAGLAAVEKLAREARPGKAREWCVLLHNEAGLGEPKCLPTRALCEAEAAAWFGPDTPKTSCYAKK
ncbi:MAG: serine/threonine protein kinase [Myxococcales bacterium]|nr:serine/threonine protein kinase [Myxococcales bacterium]